MSIDGAERAHDGCAKVCIVMEASMRQLQFAPDVCDPQRTFLRLLVRQTLDSFRDNGIVLVIVLARRIVNARLEARN